jgi:ferredoxin
MPKITFKNKDVIVEAEKGCSILEAALEHRVPIYHTCGGNCSCSTCRVLVVNGQENLSPIDAAEAQILDSFDLKAPYRLGCQALIMGGNVEVEIPKRDKPPRPNKTPRISDDSRGTY